MSNQKSKPLGQFPETLQSPAAQLDPFDWYRSQRAAGGVRYDEDRECYDVFDYETVKRVLADHDTFSADPMTHPDNTRDNTSSITRSMLYQDPPRHTELRGTVEDFFRPGTVAELAPDIERLAEDLLDRAVDGAEGRFDLVERFAYPLPVTVIAGLLGVPPEDRDQFREWTMSLVGTSTGSGDDEDRAQKKLEIYAELESYFEDLLAARRENPRDDLLSRIARAGELTADEIFGFCHLLLIAGNVTTTSLIANAVWTLSEHDHFQALHDDEEALHDDEEALDLAIEEVLRYRTPVHAMQRWTTQPVTIGDYEIPEQTSVVAWLGAANRDEAVFEDPDSFVPDRQPNRHVAFGHGRPGRPYGRCWTASRRSTP
ncbi:cytochrome P450 [Halobacteriales archaeon QS_1_68_20]|nr:MAG: cytochrome P450 [Halobacteriales archaeon QS_1_68_20]